jgi:hypothetical protein
MEGVTILDTSQLRDYSAEVIDPANGMPRILPAAFYASLSPQERAVVGARNALYSLPTLELVDWLRAEIGGRSAIEIGAGNGALAQALGIPATDNHMQADRIISAIYTSAGQKPISYGTHVEKLAAHDAIERHRPQVVVGCWVTHEWRADRQEAGGNMFGINEDALLDAVETYIFIGNEKVHRNKSIWSRPHRIIYPDWLHSRALNGSRNFIAVWGK